MRWLAMIPVLCFTLTAQAAEPAAGAGHAGASHASTAASRNAGEHGATPTRIGTERSAAVAAVERSVVGVDRRQINGAPAKVLTVRLDPLTADARARLSRMGYFPVLDSGLDMWCAKLEGWDADGWHSLTCIRISAPSARAR